MGKERLVIPLLQNLQLLLQNPPRDSTSPEASSSSSNFDDFFFKNFGGFGSFWNRYFNFGRNAKKARPKKKEPDPSIPDSLTTVFVSNIPRTLKMEGLRSAFEKAGYKPIEVTIPPEYEQPSPLSSRKIPTDKNRGFGFVKFETHEEQQKALNHRDLNMRYFRLSKGMNIQGTFCKIYLAKEKTYSSSFRSRGGKYRK